MMKSLKNNFGHILVWFLAAIPIILWFFMKPLEFRFISSSITFRSLGQLTGLLGMVLLSINFVLSARFKFLDEWFNGLNRVYTKHHIIGAIAFCLLLFHPTLLIIQYLLISLKASFIFIFSFENLPLVLGEIALLVLIALMVVTFYLNFKYQNWKNTHKYLGITLFLGGLHMLFIQSDISSSTILKYYMFGLAILAAYSYLYRTIFGVYKNAEYRYKLEEIIKVNGSIAELKLSPLAEKIKFLPGQFIFLRFKNNKILSESHPFSITSISDDDDLSLGIKTLGDYTSTVYLLKPGAICFIEGPFGTFSYKKAESKRQIWIAAGIGVTPFLGMARQIDEDKYKNGGYKIDLYYSVKNAGEAAFAEEFTEIANRNGNFKFHQNFSEKNGRISAKFVVDGSGDIRGAEIFLCGPDDFMQGLREQFLTLGFRNYEIHSEEFSM